MFLESFIFMQVRLVEHGALPGAQVSVQMFLTSFLPHTCQVFSSMLVVVVPSSVRFDLQLIKLQGCI